MRSTLVRVVAALGATLVPAAAAHAARVQPEPVTTPVSHATGRVARAVVGARRSRYLWATVNVCMPSRRHGGVIGVRGEMPSLGFRATLTMTIVLQQYSTRQQRYVAVPGSTATHTVSLGPLVRGVHQDGAEFPYASDAGLLDGRVTFTWTRDGRPLLRVTRRTTSGHPSAAYGHPAGHSSAACRL